MKLIMSCLISTLLLSDLIFFLCSWNLIKNKIVHLRIILLRFGKALL